MASSSSDAAAKQIEQMIKFISQEADDQVKTLLQEAEEMYVIEKQKLVEDQRKKLQTEKEKKIEQMQVKKRVDRSHLIKEQRHAVLLERESMLKELGADLERRFTSLVGNPEQNKKLILLTAVEALTSLKVDAGLIACRATDKTLLESLLPTIAQQVKANVGFNCTVEIDRQPLLPDVIGGVICFSKDKSLRCDNTLLQRKAQVMKERLPDVRALLFGELTSESQQFKTVQLEAQGKIQY